MLTLVAVLVASPVFAQMNAEDVVKWKTKAAHVEDDMFRVTFEADIMQGWHIYDLGPYDNGIIATTFEFEDNANIELVGTAKEVTPTVRKLDDIWGIDVGYIEGRHSFTQDVKLKGDKATLAGMIVWQPCNDGMCLAPGELEFSMELVNPVVTTAAVATSGAGATQQAESVTTDEPVAETVAANNNETAIVSAEEGEGKSFWSKIWGAILGGLIAIVTPCVFPMVPVTVSFFMKSGDNKARARFMATSFGVFIIILYTLPIFILSLVAELWGGANGAVGAFNWLGTHWVPNTIFFIVFMIFAASLFGAFEITLPSSMINKSDSKADKGGLVGVFFMALTLVLISFSCTAPIVSAVIIEAATSSTSWWEPVIVMLIYSLIFAVPFTLLAFAPSLMDKLKSGSWLNAVKVSLGFVEVALGFKFLMVIDQTYTLNLFSREIYLAIWIACALLWGLYLLGVYKTKHDSDVQKVGPVRLGFAIIVFVFTIWMFPGMIGAPLKPLSGYMPPMNAQNFTVASIDDLQNISVAGGSVAQAPAGAFDGKINPLTGKAPKYSDISGIHAPRGFVAFFDYNEAVEYAKSVNKPVFIDFTGASCVNCRDMEQRVWTDSEVKRLLNDEYVMVCIFMDVRANLDERDWVTTESGRVLKRLNNVNMEWAAKNFQTAGQPEYVILDPRDGEWLGPKRAYNTDIDAYRQWLEEGVATYKAK